jgi:hypothetical protein
MLASIITWIKKAYRKIVAWAGLGLKHGIAN